MKLEKLFETQKVLRDRIRYDESDRFNKLILALLVEIGECANEWRGFKFWSKDKQPRTHKARVPYMDIDDAEFYNPLLEEYVDCLHFILEIGIEIDFEQDDWNIKAETFEDNDPTMQFIFIYEQMMEFRRSANEYDYVDLLELFIGLGEMLGFTWEEVEQAYYAKNAINHQRQESGY